ncbi:MAG: hypothetical protein KatS3mg066_2995 [Fischerella sp.]|nr:MAG: hypothetical protein KatS3mg066_2995 [Fischerella sp.]
MKSACDRLSCSLIHKKQGWLLPQPPDFLKSVLGDKSRLLVFTTPAPEGVEYVGRNHPLVEGLARYILEEALSQTKDPIAARCSLTITNAVQKPTILLLVRLRHLLNSAKQQSLLAEECAVIGFTGSPSSPHLVVTTRSHVFTTTSETCQRCCISDQADKPPIHIVGCRLEIDKRPPSGTPRLSPHALVQEYLNKTEHLWAIARRRERITCDEEERLK